MSATNDTLKAYPQYTNKKSHLSCNKALKTAAFLITAGIAPLFFSANSMAVEAATPPLTFTNQQMSSLGIKTVPLKQMMQYPSETYPAEAVVPLSQTHLVTSPISGLITKVYHVHGPINKGDVIAEILSPELLKAQKNYLNTLSDLSTAKSSLARALKLTANGVVSVKNKQQAQADVNKLTQIKRQQREDLALMGMSDSTIQKLEKTQKQQSAIIQVLAPETGELFDLKAKVGERLMANQTLISIGIVNPIVVNMRVPVTQLKTVHEGMTSVLLATDNHRLSKGVIAHISSFVDPMTQSVEIHNRFDNQDGNIHPGQLFQIEFIHRVKTGEHVYQAPASALANYNQQDVVFLIKQHQISVQPIQVLLQQKGIMVFETLQPIDETQHIVSQSTSAVKAALMAAGESSQGGDE